MLSTAGFRRAPAYDPATGLTGAGDAPRVAGSGRPAARAVRGATAPGVRLSTVGRRPDRGARSRSIRRRCWRRTSRRWRSIWPNWGVTDPAQLQFPRSTAQGRRGARRVARSRSSRRWTMSGRITAEGKALARAAAASAAGPYDPSQRRRRRGLTAAAVGGAARRARAGWRRTTDLTRRLTRFWREPFGKRADDAHGRWRGAGPWTASDDGQAAWARHVGAGLSRPGCAAGGRAWALPAG